MRRVRLLQAPRTDIPMAPTTTAMLGGLLALLLATITSTTAAAGAADAPYPFAPEPFECDVPRETRAMISLRALEILRRNGFEHVETGFYASHVRLVWGVYIRAWVDRTTSRPTVPRIPMVQSFNPRRQQNQVPKDGETVAGNPNTLYGFVGFNDSNFQLVPPDYPPFDWPPDQPSGACSCSSFLPRVRVCWGKGGDLDDRWDSVMILIRTIPYIMHRHRPAQAQPPARADRRGVPAAGGRGLPYVVRLLRVPLLDALTADRPVGRPPRTYLHNTHISYIVG